MTPHIFVAHFPVALIMVGALADVYGVGLKRKELRGFASSLLILGGAFVLMSFMTGQGALDAAMARTPQGSIAIESHQQWGAVGTWVVVGTAALRAAWRRSLDGARGYGLLAAALLAAAVVTGIAISGSTIAHG
ncbi:MAG TPA: DUF2231 domain-containing protein [Longimicrobium sp.]|uniref:DUF2231 domain-containing protein n=1 Tax=Longimicrobium sp. TaxID=2029185 RepID=UPI002EDA79FE